jgi:hypothetical protein
MCIYETTPKTHQTEFESLIQKLHRKTLYMLSRKGRFLHQEPNKIGFEFLCFFYDFLQIFEIAAETLKNFYYN